MKNFPWLKYFRAQSCQRVTRTVTALILIGYLAGTPFVFAGRTRQKLVANGLIKRPHQLIYFIWYDISDAAAVRLGNNDLAMAIDDGLNTKYSQGEKIVRDSEATDNPKKYREPINKGCPKDTDDCDAVKVSLKKDGDSIRLTVYWHDGLKQESDTGDIFHPRPQFVNLGVCSNITGDARKIGPCKSYIIKSVCDTLSKHQHGGVSQ